MHIGHSCKGHGSIVSTMRGHRLPDVATVIHSIVPNPELYANREECSDKVKLHQRQRQEAALTGRGHLSSVPRPWYPC